MLGSSVSCVIVDKSLHLLPLCLAAGLTLIIVSNCYFYKILLHRNYSLRTVGQTGNRDGREI